MKELILIVLISAIIGWITNYLAIKMLFRPYKEINLGLFKIQGLIPRRRAEIGQGIANVIEKELISVKDVIENIDRDKFSLKLEELIDQILQKNLKSKLKEMFPLMQFFLTDNVMSEISSTIKNVVMENQDKIIEVFSNYAEDNIKFTLIISEKISSFSLDKLEKIIIELAKKELKHIEVIGGILGGIIGLVEYLIFRFI
ncbi:DUF445 domain-containing protein [Fusobacterium massiliense]|uniref:DUF445 domain-containing protein n=1 Tax=Fusobacterium massiliense TaxID=1852365 RepID=UPI000939A73E|nr:DUF445 family protein [Fusobacterium massiliense]